jgi:pyridoxal phosphate enzyme (YggS family)
VTGPTPPPTPGARDDPERAPAERERIIENLDVIRTTIARAVARSGREVSEVTLVAAAKSVPPHVVRWVAEAGVTAIGENYVNELRAARVAVSGVRWHYIGALQTSSAGRVADLADVVETLAGERAVRRLAGRAARNGRTLEVLIEVDFTGERTGVPPERVPELADLVAGLDGVRLRGLMTLPPMPRVAEDARPWFARLRTLRDEVRRDHPEVLDLSMGMSLDYRVAVEEGATMVRIGTALFGPRAA